MAVADGAGLPVAISVAGALPHEVTLVEPNFETRLVEELTQRLIGDKRYDSDPLDEALEAMGIQIIAPPSGWSPKRSHVGVLGGGGRDGVSPR